MSATTSSESPVAIVAALRAEVRPLERALGGRRVSSRSAAQRFLEGELDGRRALLTATGVGARAAAAGARRTLERLDGLGWKDARIAIVGVAGGLSPSARLGEVFVFDRCVRFEEDPPKSRRLELRTVEGPRQPSQLLTLDRIVVDPVEKRTLWQRLGEPEVAAVDMETFHSAELFAAAGCEVLALRAISDGPADALPAWLAECADPQGGLSQSKVALRALGRPLSVRVLLELRWRMNLASERLCATVRELLAVRS